jgi:hypothetical protein
MIHHCTHSSRHHFTALAALLLGLGGGLTALELSAAPPVAPRISSAANRFTDNDNGTITDRRTGLIWLKNANCAETVGGVDKSDGVLALANARTWTAALDNGYCGLSDGSTASQWRLPKRKELRSLIDYRAKNPALPLGHPFTDVQSNYYWSSTAFSSSTRGAWGVNLANGIRYAGGATFMLYVWPVRQPANIIGKSLKPVVRLSRVAR